MMRKLYLFILILLPISSVWGQTVKFVIGDGMNDGPLKEKMGSNISLLLTEINRAYGEREPLDMSTVSITDDAVNSMAMIWRNSPFRCDETWVVDRVLRTSDGGFQVRRIPIEMKDDAGSTIFQELVVDMDAAGTIFLVNLAIAAHLYRNIMSEGTDETDLRYRQMILDYVEQFRTSYNRKDIEFLEMIFSDDALIITGKVVKKNGRDRTAILKNEIVYRKYNKAEYLANLQRVFNQNAFINVKFSDIRVTRHPTIDGYYGVLVKQGYESSIYSDEGYVFMLWDFRDESHPQIHVRTWQPYWMDDAHTQTIDEKEIYNINSFRIK